MPARRRGGGAGAGGSAYVGATYSAEISSVGTPRTTITLTRDEADIRPGMFVWFQRSNAGNFDNGVVARILTKAGAVLTLNRPAPAQAVAGNTLYVLPMAGVDDPSTHDAMNPGAGIGDYRLFLPGRPGQSFDLRGLAYTLWIARGRLRFNNYSVEIVWVSAGAGGAGSGVSFGPRDSWRLKSAQDPNDDGEYAIGRLYANATNVRDWLMLYDPADHTLRFVADPDEGSRTSGTPVLWDYIYRG